MSEHVADRLIRERLRTALSLARRQASDLRLCRVVAEDALHADDPDAARRALRDIIAIATHREKENSYE